MSSRDLFSEYLLTRILETSSIFLHRPKLLVNVSFDTKNIGSTNRVDYDMTTFSFQTHKIKKNLCIKSSCFETIENECKFRLGLTTKYHFKIKNMFIQKNNFLSTNI